MTFSKTTYLLIILAMLLQSCGREDFEGGGVDFQPVDPPEIEIDNTDDDVFGISFRSADKDEDVAYQDGFGSVEKVTDDQYFLEVLVRMDNSSGLDPFLMGWFSDDLNTGVRDGEIAYFVITEPDGSSYNIASGLGSPGTSFTVDLTEIGELGDIMLGTFKGVGIKSTSGELIDFSGSFKVLQGYCINRIIIDEMKYLTAPSNKLEILKAEILGRCLYLNYRALETCGVSNTNLYDSGSVINGLIPERSIRLVIDPGLGCTTEIESDASFNIDNLRVGDSKKVILRLEGLEEPLTFEYE